MKGADIATWPEVPPASLVPRLLLVGYHILKAPYYPRWNNPGIFLMLIDDGAITYATANGTEGCATKGNLVCFYPGISHYRVHEPKPLVSHMVTFWPASPPLERGTPVLPGFGRIPERVSVAKCLPEVVSIYERIMKAVLKLDATWQLETASLLTRLISMVFTVALGNRPAELPAWNRWERLLATLERKPRIPSVAALAQEFGMGVKSFRREFTKHTGKTPKQYFLERRLWTARRMLQQGRSVKETAIETGFADPLYFSRLYRKHFGAAPSKTQPSTHFPFPDIDQSLPVCRLMYAPGIASEMFLLKEAVGDQRTAISD